MLSPFATSAFKDALGKHIELQLSFVNDIGNKMLNSSEQMMQLSLQLTHDVISQMSTASHELMQAQNPAEFASMLSNQVQPVAEHWRNYQQRLPNLLASTHVELTKVAELHVPKATRSAVAIADEIARAAAEEAERVSANQRAMLEKISLTSDDAQNGARQERRVH
jgi:phasin family protein